MLEDDEILEQDDARYRFLKAFAPDVFKEKERRKRMRTEHYYCDSCKKELDTLNDWNKAVIKINGMPDIELDLCNDCCYKFMKYIEDTFLKEDGVYKE